MRGMVAALILLGFSLAAAADPPAARITVLSDAFGKDRALHKDWGFAALVEAGGRRILFDTGDDADHFAANVRKLGIDLTRLDAVVISHRHSDHTDGLRHVLQANPHVPVYVPADEYFGGSVPAEFFAHAEPSLPAHMRYFDGAVPDRVPHGTPWDGANFVVVAREREIASGVRLVANLSPGPLFKETPEVSLVVDTPAGRILLVGCSHPGVERILDSAGAREGTIRLLVGGLHLVATPPEEVSRIATTLRDEWKIGGIAPGHCSGEHAFAALSEAFEDRYVYAGVGSVIELRE